jgi:hypothetical protein
MQSRFLPILALLVLLIAESSAMAEPSIMLSAPAEPTEIEPICEAAFKPADDRMRLDELSKGKSCLQSILVSEGAKIGVDLVSGLHQSFMVQCRGTLTSRANSKSEGQVEISSPSDLFDVIYGGPGVYGHFFKGYCLDIEMNTYQTGLATQNAGQGRREGSNCSGYAFHGGCL